MSTRLTRGRSAGNNGAHWFGAPTPRCPGSGHAPPPRAQPTADEQAAEILNAGRKAYADANPQFAAEKFREFLTKFGAHKDANAARFGLGLALLDLPDRDFQKA